MFLYRNGRDWEARKDRVRIKGPERNTQLDSVVVHPS